MSSTKKEDKNKKTGLIAGIEKSQVEGAGRQILEELFYDMYVHRKRIYLINLFRGLFFGIGSAIGATIVVAIIFWGMSQLVDVPVIGDFLRGLLNTVEESPVT